MSVKVFEAKLGDIAALRPGQGESGKLGKRAVARDLITSYSPWLAEFHAQDHDPLEIPGQYTGLAKPCPELHAKMATVDQRVLVMQSIRRPKRITITTTDEKEYRFLVKGGEDLRLDQRIQQLFTVMNSLMRRNGYCAAHNVVVATYKIVPMTSRLGIIEWVPDTSPFKSCVESQNRSMDNWNQAYKTFKRWIDRFGSSPYTAYPKMYNSNRQEVEKNFRSVQSYIPGNLLRNMLYKLAFGAEEFFTIRAQFVHSLAALSITSYILGIGDRHCDNFLVDLKSGRLIPIDFGHAFGSATEILPVPELMPFRLTRQFEGVLEPLGISGLLEPAMVNVLQAIRDGKDQVLNVMDVFCKEPLLDWKEHAIRQAKRQNAVRIETPDISSKLAEIAWYPQQKIVIARRKLEGENPAFITVEELANGHRNAPFFELLREIAMGDKKLNVRAQSPQHTASVRDQVLCLLDQATDPNILGRTYIGWMPW